DRDLEHHLPRHDVETLHHVEDQLVVALGRQDDERVGDVVRDDAHLLLEDGWRALRLPGYAGRSGWPAGKRDATRPARGSGHRPGDPGPAGGPADPAAPTEAPTGAGAASRKPSPGGMSRSFSQRSISVNMIGSKAIATIELRRESGIKNTPPSPSPVGVTP